MKNYYEILGLSFSSNPEEELIKAAYRAKVKLYHPDVYNGKNREKLIKDINEAYHVLRDFSRKSSYDKKYKSYFSGEYNLNKENYSAKNESKDNKSYETNTNFQDKKKFLDVEIVKIQSILKFFFNPILNYIKYWYDFTAKANRADYIIPAIIINFSGLFSTLKAERILDLFYNMEYIWLFVYFVGLLFWYTATVSLGVRRLNDLKAVTFLKIIYIIISVYFIINLHEVNSGEFFKSNFNFIILLIYIPYAIILPLKKGV